MGNLVYTFSTCSKWLHQIDEFLVTESDVINYKYENDPTILSDFINYESDRKPNLQTDFINNKSDQYINYKSDRDINYKSDRDINYKSEQDINYKSDQEINYKSDRNIDYKSDRNINYKSDQDINYKFDLEKPLQSEYHEYRLKNDLNFQSDNRLNLDHNFTNNNHINSDFINYNNPTLHVDFINDKSNNHHIFQTDREKFHYNEAIIFKNKISIGLPIIVIFPNHTTINAILTNIDNNKGFNICVESKFRTIMFQDILDLIYKNNKIPVIQNSKYIKNMHKTLNIHQILNISALSTDEDTCSEYSGHSSATVPTKTTSSITNISNNSSIKSNYPFLNSYLTMAIRFKHTKRAIAMEFNSLSDILHFINFICYPFQYF